ncbi:hypothetical protein [Micromonospora sp. NPDC126480]|uniref:hypothetical protein n=1 Tax=Micromonospora sp. NPDC126480 TaxID=3155312 RepID=UPI0033328E38
MIVASLLLILLAVVLLVVGLAGGSSVLLILSIAASLLAAVALVAGARQAAAARLTAERVRPSTTATARPAASGPPTGSDIPVQHGPPPVDTAGRRPPSEPAAPVAPVPADPADDEPAAQDVPLEDAARLARLEREVRVVDGRPRYHLAACPHLIGREHEALPVAEAVDLGFTPCAHCAPATALLAGAGRIRSGDAGA